MMAQVQSLLNKLFYNIQNILYIPDQKPGVSGKGSARKRKLDNDEPGKFSVLNSFSTIVPEGNVVKKRKLIKDSKTGTTIIYLQCHRPC